MVPKTCPEFVFATKNILGGVVQNLKSGSFISVSRCCLDVENDKNLLIIEKKLIELWITTTAITIYVKTQILLVRKIVSN